MKRFACIAATILLCAFAVAARAETLADAKAMLEAALSHHAAVGHDAAMKDFVEGNPVWRKGVMYMVVVGFDGQMYAHTANAKMVGKNMYEVKDARGKAFVQEAIAGVKGNGEMVIEFAWTNPATKRIDDAHMYVRRLNGMDAYIGAVFFKQH